jgi:hypothetical protein
MDLIFLISLGPLVLGQCGYREFYIPFRAPEGACPNDCSPNDCSPEYTSSTTASYLEAAQQESATTCRLLFLNSIYQAMPHFPTSLCE